MKGIEKFVAGLTAFGMFAGENPQADAAPTVPGSTHSETQKDKETIEVSPHEAYYKSRITELQGQVNILGSKRRNEEDPKQKAILQEEEDTLQSELDLWKMYPVMKLMEQDNHFDVNNLPPQIAKHAPYRIREFKKKLDEETADAYKQIPENAINDSFRAFVDQFHIPEREALSELLARIHYLLSTAELHRFADERADTLEKELAQTPDIQKQDMLKEQITLLRSKDYQNLAETIDLEALKDLFAQLVAEYKIKHAALTAAIGQDPENMESLKDESGILPLEYLLVQLDMQLKKRQIKQEKKDAPQPGAFNSEVPFFDATVSLDDLNDLK